VETEPIDDSFGRLVVGDRVVISIEKQRKSISESLNYAARQRKRNAHHQYKQHQQQKQQNASFVRDIEELESENTAGNYAAVFGESSSCLMEIEPALCGGFVSSLGSSNTGMVLSIRVATFPHRFLRFGY
jgi:hypothetical protein